MKLNRVGFILAAGASCGSACAAFTKTEDAMTSIVESVRDIGPQFTTNTVNSLGHDAAYTIPRANGDPRTLWMFGDTWSGTRDPDTGTSIIKGMPTNTMAFTTDTDARDGIQGAAYTVDREGAACAVLQYLHHEESKRIKDGTIAMRLWPMHGIALPSSGGGSKVVLFYSLTTLIDGPEPPGNFRHLGTGIATMDVRPSDKTPPPFKRILKNGDPILWGPDEPIVGTSVLRGEDGMIYVYATGQKNKWPTAYVAKVREGSLTDPGAFRWFAGRNGNAPARYAGSLKDAEPVFDGMPTEMSVTYNKYLRKYVAVHTVLLGPDTAIRTAPEPDGPWSKSEIFFRPKGASSKSFFYAAKEHPWLARDFGKTLYVTYIDFAEYWPHLIEVKLK